MKLTLLQRPECLNYNSICGRVILPANLIAAYCKILTLDPERELYCAWCLPLCESRCSHHGDCGQLTSVQTQRIPPLRLKSRTIVSFPVCVPWGPPSGRSGCGQHSEGTAEVADPLPVFHTLNLLQKQPQSRSVKSKHESLLHFSRNRPFSKSVPCGYPSKWLQIYSCLLFTTNNWKI
jgi:hypothetical protein